MDHAWPDTNHRSANASMGSSTVFAFISRLRSRVTPSGPTDESMLDPDQEIFDNLRRLKWLLAPVDSPYSRRSATHRSSTRTLAAYIRGRDPTHLGGSGHATDNGDRRVADSYESGRRSAWARNQRTTRMTRM